MPNLSLHLKLMLVINAKNPLFMLIFPFCSVLISHTEENRTFLSSVTSSLLTVHGPTAKSRLKLKTVKSRIITVIGSYRFSIVIRDWARAMVLNKGQFCPLGTFSNVWGHFWLSWTERGILPNALQCGIWPPQ